jgi:hypothetical protein
MIWRKMPGINASGILRIENKLPEMFILLFILLHQLIKFRNIFNITQLRSFI